MAFATAKDDTQIYFKDWGSGPPVVFSHGWPLIADAWDPQLKLMADNGFRAVAHDRRGGGRSGQSWKGNDLDTYAEDLASVIEALDLRDVILVGHSIPPLMLKTEANPEGLPIDVFDELRKGVLTDRSQFYKDLSAPFYGANREGATISQGIREEFWLWSMTGGIAGAHDCIKAFSETDLTEDLKKFDIPTLIIHGDDDQIVPIVASANKSSQFVKDVTFKVYPGAPHGLSMVPEFAGRFNADLLEFARG